MPPPSDRDAGDAVVAYCAPGRKAYAELLLALLGERVREVVEHPWFAGRDEVLLAADPVFPLPPFGALDEAPDR